MKEAVSPHVKTPNKRISPASSHTQEGKSVKILAGKKILVTGAHTEIGGAVAIAFANEGADIALVYLPETEKTTRETFKAIVDQGKKAICIRGDLTQEEFCKTIAQQAIDGLGSIDILVNSAEDVEVAEELEDLTTWQFQKTFATNLYSLFWIIKSSVPYMKSGSSIINITASESIPVALDYASSRGAVMAFTKNISKMLVNKGIRVNAIAPGSLEDLKGLAVNDSQIIHADYEINEKNIDQKKFEQNNIMKAFLYLVSNQSNHLNGKVIEI